MREPTLTSQPSSTPQLAAELDEVFLHLVRARMVLICHARHAAVIPFPSRADAASGDSVRRTGMTVSEAAAVLRLSVEHVRCLLRSGDLHGVRYGGRIGWRLHRDYVVQLARQWETNNLIRIMLDWTTPW